MNAKTQTFINECDRLEAEVKASGAALKTFPKGPMGLTTDAIKASPEYRAAKRRYDIAFAALRTFNAKRAR